MNLHVLQPEDYSFHFWFEKAFEIDFLFSKQASPAQLRKAHYFPQKATTLVIFQE